MKKRNIKPPVLRVNRDREKVKKLVFFISWVMVGSNHRPFRCKRIALPTELNTLAVFSVKM